MSRTIKTFKDYQHAAMRTAGARDRDQLINGALGLAGETGEVIDLIKKHTYHAHPLDVKALTNELGDVLWYLASIADQIGVSLEDVAAQNITKLQKRYPEGFDAKRSLDRSGEVE